MTRTSIIGVTGEIRRLEAKTVSTFSKGEAKVSVLFSISSINFSQEGSDKLKVKFLK
jgi:hypothetical protein